MPLDRETIGRNLRTARKNRGISQKQAAKHLGLSRSLIAQIELGNRSISSDELAKLVALYQRSAEEFSPEVAQREDDALAHVFKIAPTLRADLKRALEGFIGLCEEAAALENSLGRVRLGPPRYELAAPRNTADAIVQGEQIAAQERQRLGFGPAPSARVPTNWFARSIICASVFG